MKDTFGQKPRKNRAAGKQLAKTELLEGFVSFAPVIYRCWKRLAITFRLTWNDPLLFHDKGRGNAALNSWFYRDRMNIDEFDHGVTGPCLASGSVFNTKVTSSLLDRVYFCDAGCRPNPGRQLPIAWDGEDFLKTHSRKGTNHRAIYQALQAIFDDAIFRNFRHIAVKLTSNLVFTQMTTGAYCSNPALIPHQKRALFKANRVGSIHLALVEEPFTLGSHYFPTRHDLRDYAVSLSRYRGSSPTNQSFVPRGSNTSPSSSTPGSIIGKASVSTHSP